MHPISIVEIEVSPTSYEDETRNVIATAAELDVAVAGYSYVLSAHPSPVIPHPRIDRPLGQGLLSGAVTQDLDREHRS